MIARVMTILGLVSLLALAGCQSSPFSRGSSNSDTVASADSTSGTYESPAVPPSGLALSSDQRFADVPLPVGLKEDSERSYVYETPSLQIGRMIYKSRADMGELAQFYLDEAPTAQWTFKNIAEAENSSELLFAKPGRTLKVLIEDLGPVKGRRLTLHLTPDHQ